MNEEDKQEVAAVFKAIQSDVREWLTSVEKLQLVNKVQVVDSLDEAQENLQNISRKLGTLISAIELLPDKEYEPETTLHRLAQAIEPSKERWNRPGESKQKKSNAMP